MFRTLLIGIAFVAVAAFAQTKPSFEVATVKPAQPLDQAKMVAALRSSTKLPIGAIVDAHRAEYLYLDLKTLVTYAYGGEALSDHRARLDVDDAFRHRCKDARWSEEGGRTEDAAVAS